MVSFGNGSINGPSNADSVTIIAGSTCGASYTVESSISCSGCSPSPIVCSKIISVEDNTLPSITCPPNINVQCEEDVPPADFSGGTASDNCDTTLVITFASGPIDGGGCGGTIIRTWTATDDCGNTATCNQIITVDDITVPEISCPAGFSVQCVEDVPICDPADATATDNCGEVTITCGQGALVGGNCGGTITNTYTATDECGNTATCTQIITIDDTTDPVISCPSDFTVQCIEDVPPCNSGDATATDNCTEVTITCVQGSLVGDECGGNYYKYLYSYRRMW